MHQLYNQTIFSSLFHQVTTINGAAIVNEKQDITIPQGVTHGVDRVMFPLPVGDLLQTLQSDRERRFTNFLRAVFTADMAELLQSKGPCHLKGFNRVVLKIGQ